jgi:hypothetical protein
MGTLVGDLNTSSWDHNKQVKPGNQPPSGGGLTIKEKEKISAYLCTVKHSVNPMWPFVPKLAGWVAARGQVYRFPTLRAPLCTPPESPPPLPPRQCFILVGRDTDMQCEEVWYKEKPVKSTVSEEPIYV